MNKVFSACAHKGIDAFSVECSVVVTDCCLVGINCNLFFILL